MSRKHQKVGGVFSEGEWRALIERVEHRTGERMTLERQEFVLASMTSSSAAEAARKLVAASEGREVAEVKADPEASQRAARMAAKRMQSQAVRELLAEVRAQKFSAADVDGDLVMALTLRELEAPDSTSRDRLKAIEMAGRQAGVYKDVVDHRHVHMHRSSEDMLVEMADRWGIEAALKEATDLGWTPPEREAFAERYRSAGRVVREAQAESVEIEGEVYERLPGMGEADDKS